jgi:hypothetical protein
MALSVSLIFNTKGFFMRQLRKTIYPSISLRLCIQPVPIIGSLPCTAHASLALPSAAAVLSEVGILKKYE